MPNCSIRGLYNVLKQSAVIQKCWTLIIGSACLSAQVLTHKSLCLVRFIELRCAKMKLCHCYILHKLGHNAE